MVTSQLLLRFNSDSHRSGLGSVIVHNLDHNLLVTLGSDAQLVCLLRCIFRVTVVQAGWPQNDSLPDVLGHYQVLKDSICFIPHFPFEPGVQYRASFDLRLLDSLAHSEVLTLEFSPPKEQNSAPPEVTHIFPSSDSLPENVLRFYVCFSGPMQRGRFEEQVVIIGPDGRPAPDVLYRPPVELWDKEMRHLTILLDPGRLKRLVGPNVALGPPLKAGVEYTLVIGSGMVDSSGCPLSKAFHKHFRVTDAVREHIAVEQWQIVPPVAKSHQPLAIEFPRPLDWALLLRTITIASTAGVLVEGRIEINQCETAWSFTPTSPWAAGSYYIRVAPSLEDVCGNSVIAPFDRPLRASSDWESRLNHSGLSSGVRGAPSGGMVFHSEKESPKEIIASFCIGDAKHATR